MSENEAMHQIANIAVESDAEFFLKSPGRKIKFIPSPVSSSNDTALYADYGDFRKWAHANHPDVILEAPQDKPLLSQHSSEIWLPLMHLAGDVSAQLALNMVASYLYDRAKGALKTERPKVYLSTIFYDENSGLTKKFTFEGDAEALERVIKKFDVNRFMENEVK